MAKRKPKKAVKKATAVAEALSPVNGANVEEPQFEKKEDDFVDSEVQRQGTAIRAIRDVEIEHLLTQIRLLRSYFSKEQLQTPALQFFKEHFPNVKVVRNGDNGRLEMQLNDRTGNLYTDQGDGRDVHTSLLRHLSLAYPDYSATMPSFGGYEFSTKSVKTYHLGVDKLQTKGFVLEEPSDTRTGMQDAVQTPGVSSQRLSIGMTPKTRRVPKHGEMLLSVHGSPLGVYKEDEMEAIRESEEG